MLVLKEWVYYRHNFLKESQIYSTAIATDSSTSAQAVKEQPNAYIFGYGKSLFATQVPKNNFEKRIKPGFILFLDAVS